jgi:spermidine/putrescine transport system permease protein
MKPEAPSDNYAMGDNKGENRDSSPYSSPNLFRASRHRTMKPFTLGPARMAGMKHAFRFSYLVFAYAFLYVPLLILVVYSFLTKQHTLTSSWYQQLLSDPNLWGVARNSLVVAITAATLSTALGTVTAMVLFRYRFLGRKFLNGVLLSYVILPDLVIGISALLLLHLFHIQLGFFTLLLGHMMLCLPFVVITVNSRLYDFDQRLFEAAKDLGASEFILFFRIVMPLLAPAIVAAWLMCFTLSMDDVIISFFLTGPGFQVLPLYIYSLVRLGITPEINALCSIIFFVMLLLILIAQWGLRQK